MDPAVVARTACAVGENPRWNPVHDKLYWCDIPAGKIYRFDPATERHALVYDDGAVGGFTVQTDGSLLLFKEAGAIVEWDQGEMTTVVEGLEDERDTRFNDVQPDPLGGVFCGTMPTANRAGRLYRLSPAGEIVRVEDGLAIPNGMAFSSDEDYVYLTESQAGTIWQFSFDEASGAISGKEALVEVDGPGVPDGLTVDDAGYLWSARWDGSMVVRYSDAGREVDRIEFPTAKVSSVTFGGKRNEDLYVTTAGGDEPEANGELAGSLFRLTPDVSGTRQYLSDVSV